MLLSFTEENLVWLDSLVVEAMNRTKDEVKLVKMTDMRQKIEAIGQERLTVTITKEQIEETDTVISDLQTITDEYAKSTDISALELYDTTKKKITSKLQYLATYKDIFMDESNYLEDVFKKEVRIRLAMEIKESEGVSFTQADKLVDTDVRYTQLRSEVHYVKRIANKIKTKYDFYMKFWQMVFQSVSTASKERYASRHNNDT